MGKHADFENSLNFFHSLSILSRFSSDFSRLRCSFKGKTLKLEENCEKTTRFLGSAARALDLVDLLDLVAELLEISDFCGEIHEIYKEIQWKRKKTDVFEGLAAVSRRFPWQLVVFVLVQLLNDVEIVGFLEHFRRNSSFYNKKPKKQ